MKRIVSACGVALVFSFAASADEVWSTTIGDVIYERDQGDMAILSFPLDSADTERGHVFVVGLGGNYEDRGHFTGYWSEPASDDSLCPVSIVDENGLTTNNWGRMTMTFLDAGFPSSWVAVRGNCFEEPTDHLVGNPVVAPGVH